jgi:imidazolonepropionase
MAGQHGQIAWMGNLGSLPASFQLLPHIDVRSALATPGLIGRHMHLVYGGQCVNEFAMCLASASYEELARAGGGMVSWVEATRAASEEELYALAAPRLQRLLADGVCVIEIKSGYGLSLGQEAKQLRVARCLGLDFGVTVRTSFLGGHAPPPNYTPPHAP